MTHSEPCTLEPSASTSWMMIANLYNAMTIYYRTSYCGDPTIKLILLLLQNCNFSTFMNSNIHNWYAVCLIGPHLLKAFILTLKVLRNTNLTFYVNKICSIYCLQCKQKDVSYTLPAVFVRIGEVVASGSCIWVTRIGGRVQLSSSYTSTYHDVSG